jgi:hypothetical protein
MVLGPRAPPPYYDTGILTMDDKVVPTRPSSPSIMAVASPTPDVSGMDSLALDSGGAPGDFASGAPGGAPGGDDYIQVDQERPETTYPCVKCGAINYSHPPKKWYSVVRGLGVGVYYGQVLSQFARNVISPFPQR